MPGWLQHRDRKYRLPEPCHGALHPHRYHCPPYLPRHHPGPHSSAMRMTDLSGLPIALGAKPAFAIVAMPITVAAPKISDRTIVFSPIVESPHIQSKRFGDERPLNVRPIRLPIRTVSISAGIAAGLRARPACQSGFFAIPARRPFGASAGPIANLPGSSPAWKRLLQRHQERHPYRLFA